MKHLCQRDPQWSNIKIGNSNVTVGQDGCLLTCVSMLSDYFGCYMTPGQIAEQKGWFDNQGEMLFIELSFAHMRFLARPVGRNDARIGADLIAPAKACILGVWPDSQGRARHWIQPIQKVMHNGKIDFLCIDPWTGSTCFALATYKAIVGFAEFIKK